MVSREVALASGAVTLGSPEQLEARLFLAQFCKAHGLFEEAQQHAQSLLDAGGPTKETAKVLLTELRQMAPQASATATRGSSSSGSGGGGGSSGGVV